VSSHDLRIRISSIAPDWVDKGCHLHVGSVEIALRPDHLGGLVCRPIFSSISDDDLRIACREMFRQMEDPDVRNRLRDALE
jgi:hypothetical protein